jgi:hypothetical protein
VNVPGTSFFVIDVSGGSDISRIQNAFGNNDAFKTPAITDVYTTAANANNTAMDATWGNDGDEGLYPFVGLADGNGPWEWWSNAVAGPATTALMAFGAPDSATCVDNGYAGNPMYAGLGEVAGRLRALTFVDTIQGYLSPRLYRVLIENTLSTVGEVNEVDVSIYPNPSTGALNLVSKGNNPIEKVEFYSTSGQLVRQENKIGSGLYTISELDLAAGMYIVNVHFNDGLVTKKLMIR